MKDFSGMYAALLTAFNKDGSINYEATGMLAERNIQKGLKGMYVAGSSGEAMMMSEEERVSRTRLRRRQRRRSVLLFLLGRSYPRILYRYSERHRSADADI